MKHATTGILLAVLAILPELCGAETLYFLKGKIHTELALPTESVREVRPDLVEHVDTDLVLVGWGEKDYFGNPHKNMIGTMKAMLDERRKRQETGDRGQETGDRGQGTRDKGQGARTRAAARG